MAMAVSDTILSFRVTRPTPTPITDTTTTATNRNRDSSANPLNPAPITGSGIGIHKLHTQLRYAGHELPEFLRSDHRRDAGKSGRKRRCETAVVASLVIAISVVVITLVLNLGSGIGL
jgi:hypothetical protein